MEHLPPISQPHNPVIVPYRGVKYMGHGFTDFNLPNSIPLTDLQQEVVSSELASAAAPYLQTWFFFGLIHEILNLPVLEEDFVTSIAEDTKIVTTAKLKDYLARWRTNIKAAKADTTRGPLKSHNERAINCLQAAYETRMSIPQFEDIVGEEIQLSIQVLTSTLEFALFSMSEIETEDLPWHIERSPYLARRMLTDGWCPVEIEKIARAGSVPWHYYASLCPPLVTHGPEYDCQPHDPTCKLRQEQTTIAHYAPKHICPTKSCPEIQSIPIGRVEALITDGKIPLLDYDEAKSQLQVIEYQKGIRYTAVSHVWTDGMGNAERNTVLDCQLKRLVKAFANIEWTREAVVAANEEDEDKTWQTERKTIDLFPDAEARKNTRQLFWLDTICVPLEGPLRRIAMNSMRLVYNRADRVLAFDRDLVRINAPLSLEEVLTRVKLSNWLRRTWTLQEGVLAKRLWFQFGDNAYRRLTNYEQIDQEAYAAGANPETLLREAVYDNEIKWYADDLGLDWRSAGVKFSYAKRVALVWAGLQHRMSRFESDQPICIATLMDMDLDTVQGIPAEIRSRQLWTMYAQLPAGVLFAVTPKWSHAPYRWAPMSMASLGPLPPPGMNTEATVTDRGLRVRHHAIMTTEPLKTNKFGVISMQVGEQTYLIKQNLKQMNPSWEGTDFTTFDRLAVLLSQPSVAEGGEFPNVIRALGALVGIKDSVEGDTQGSGDGHGDEIASASADTDFRAGGESNVIEVEYLRAVSVLLRGNKWEYLRQVWQPWEEEEKNDVVPAIYSSVGQEWLIT